MSFIKSRVALLKERVLIMKSRGGSMKIITVIISSLLFSLSYSLILYLEQSTAIEGDRYWSFVSIFGYLFVPSFFIFFIFGGVLSPLLDRYIINRFRTSRKQVVISTAISYFGLAVLASILMSIAFSGSFFLLYYFNLSIISTSIFLIIQTIIKWTMIRVENR